MKKRKLHLDKDFKPLPRDDEDEFYPNGIFEFNVSKLLTFIKANPETFPIENADIKTLVTYDVPSCLDEVTIQNANLRTAIVLAEISPGRFNVIDGNHRLEKARREGLEKIPAYRVTADQHFPFLTSVNSYEKYVAYWNSKIDESVTELQHAARLQGIK